MMTRNDPNPTVERDNVMKKYSIIYADPPWHYKTYSPKDNGRSAEKHYPTMSIAEIKALPVEKLAADDCALFMWITFPCMKEVFEVLEAWGFQYKTIAFVWVKQNRISEELLKNMQDLHSLCKRLDPSRLTTVAHLSSVPVNEQKEEEAKPAVEQEKKSARFS